MTDETLRVAIETCRELIGTPSRIARAMRRNKTGHLATMPDRALALLEEGRREKVMRWLGFMQGALWVMGRADLETLKKANMPAGATYDEARDVSR